MSEVSAKIKIKGKDYEILVDVDKALAVKKGEGNVSEALVSDVVFHNIKAGDRAGEADLKEESVCCHHDDGQKQQCWHQPF